MLTQTQRDLLLFIEKTIDEIGRGPTHREIAAGLGYAGAGAGTARVLNCLQERGYVLIQRWPRRIVVLRPISRFAVFKFDDRTKELETHGRHFEPGATGGPDLRSKCVRKG
jgi:SOS-response transcriptional repressor LexA